MELSDYFDGGREKLNVLMLDFNNLAHKTIFGANNSYLQKVADPNFQMTPDDLYDIWKNYMIQNFFDFVKQFKPDKFIIPIDSSSWRKKVYPKYKGGRDKQRQASAVDFSVFYPIMNQFVEDLKIILPNAHILKIPECEVDDMIAVLSKTVFKDDNVIIVSTDKDFRQLLQYKNVRIFNPDSKVKDFVNCPNPKEELNLKVVIGDGGNGQGDNIPNILVFDDQEFNGEKTIGVGEVAAQEILEQGLDSDYVINKVGLKYNTVIDAKKKKFEFDKFSKEDIVNKVKENYQRNLKLISFEHIPIEIEKLIVESYENYEIKKYNSMNCFNWLLENKIRNVADNLQTYNMFLKEIN